MSNLTKYIDLIFTPSLKERAQQIVDSPGFDESAYDQYTTLVYTKHQHLQAASDYLRQAWLGTNDQSSSVGQIRVWICEARIARAKAGEVSLKCRQLDLEHNGRLSVLMAIIDKAHDTH